MRLPWKARFRVAWRRQDWPRQESCLVASLVGRKGELGYLFHEWRQIMVYAFLHSFDQVLGLFVDFAIESRIQSP